MLFPAPPLTGARPPEMRSAYEAVRPQFVRLGDQLLQAWVTAQTCYSHDMCLGSPLIDRVCSLAAR